MSVVALPAILQGVCERAGLAVQGWLGLQQHDGADDEHALRLCLRRPAGSPQSEPQRGAHGAGG